MTNPTPDDAGVYLTPAEMNALRATVAAHLGSPGVTEAGGMICPHCGGDFGPSIPLRTLAYIRHGWLPGAPVLVGACLDCGAVTEPGQGSASCLETRARLGGPPRVRPHLVPETAGTGAAP